MVTKCKKWNFRNYASPLPCPSKPIYTLLTSYTVQSVAYESGEQDEVHGVVVPVDLHRNQHSKCPNCSQNHQPLAIIQMQVLRNSQ